MDEGIGRWIDRFTDEWVVNFVNEHMDECMHGCIIRKDGWTDECMDV